MLKGMEADGSPLIDSLKYKIFALNSNIIN